MSETHIPIKVFCSYAHEDEFWLHRLETHLNPLSRQGLISLWHDRLIAPGTNSTNIIDTHLESASIILLLVSADFLASDHCSGVEMQRALARQEAGDARVIPILVRPTDLTDAPFAHLHMLPANARPIAAWVDIEMALTDVAKGIRSVIVEELSLPPACTPYAALPSLKNIPYSRNPFFMGRDELLTQLHNLLQAGLPTALSQPQAISGLGGIGKTQLAIEYAYRYCQDYQVILWARAENQETLSASYSEIAALLTLPEWETQEQQVIIQAVKRWLQMHQHWLLILDNADEPESLVPFLPVSPGGHLLITTRAANVSHLGLGFAHSLIVKTFLPEQGTLFLLHRAGVLDTPSDEASLADLFHTAECIGHSLGWLPLALDQAGAYIKATQCDLPSYQQRFEQDSRNRFLRTRGGWEHPEPVASTWSLSFQRVERRNPAAADLLRLCAFLSADAIPEEILTEGASVLGSVLSPVIADLFLLDQSIAALLAYSLIERHPRTRMLSIHRLVQAVLQDEMDQEKKKLWAERAVRAVYRALLWVEHQPWIQRDRLLPQALQCAELIATHHLTFSEAIRLLNRTASYLRESARYEEAEPLYHCALSICEQRLGKTAHIPLNSGKLDATDRLRHQQMQEAKTDKETIQKKLINKPEDIITDALAGMATAHRDVISVIKDQHVIVRKDAPVKGKVGIISGGGGGHEPLHSGFVGAGMLDAACIGPLFTSPTEDQVLAATHAVDGGAGVLFIVKNYLGDKANFLSAAVELAEEDAIEVAFVFTNDDIGVPDELPSNRRGTGVNVLLQKIVGGFAQTGASLKQVVVLAEKVNTNGRSMGMALTPCTLPATGKPLFELGADEMTIGIGIHGQRGQHTIKLETANEITERLITPLIQDLCLKPGEHVLVMVSGMGGTPLSELYIIFNAVKRFLDGKNITVTRQLVGNYITSLEMSGCSLTLLRLDDELIRYWDASVRTPALRWRC